MSNDPNSITDRAEAAFQAGECVKTACSGKEAALELIQRGEADALGVHNTGLVLESGPLIQHYAVTIDGFIKRGMDVPM